VFAKEKNAMLVKRSKSFVEFRKEEVQQSIPSRFAQQVRRFPHHIAVQTRTAQITYDELDRFSNRIAHVVLEKCGAKTAPIALLFEPGPSMLATILGVLKSGRFFLPLDPASPPARIAAILKGSLATDLLTDRKHRAAPAHLAHTPSQVIDVDDLDPHVADSPCDQLAHAESLACVLYTSGSAGEPKGVLHAHRNFLHSIREHTNSMGLHSEDRVSLLASYCHLAGMTSTWRALLNGGTLCVFNLRREGWGELPRWLSAEGITIYQSVPTLFRQWAQALTGSIRFPKLRIIHLGGEPVTIHDVELYKKYMPEDCVLVHNLGSTEVPTFRQYFIQKETPITGNVVPVGYPVEEKEVILLDESGRELGFDEVGEIVVKSRYSALGYWQKPEVTHSAFSFDPRGSDERFFRTGDLGRIRADGCLEHLGRKDRQVKIQGIRIEPAEVEAILAKHPSVRHAVVAVYEEAPGQKELVAYVVAAPDMKPSATVLREYLRGLLPAQMVPTAFVVLDHIPVTANGKVDRRALPPPGPHVRQSEAQFVAPSTFLEKTIVRTWEEVLGVPGIGVLDRFLDLGGNSLKAMQIITRLQNTLERVLPLEALFNMPTVKEQAVAIEKYLAATTNGDETALIAELEAMSEEEAERQLAALDQPTEGTEPKKSHWQTGIVSKAYLDLRSAIPDSGLEIEVMLKLIRAWYPKLRTAIDLGCGDGFLGRTLLEHFPDCHVWFLDFSDPMLDSARDKLGRSDRATIIKTDFASSEWISELGNYPAFDLVASRLAIHHQTDIRKKQLYREIYDLLSIGGIFLNLEQVASPTAEIGEVYREYLIDYLHAFYRQSDPDRSRQDVADGFYSSPARKEDLLALVEAQCGWLREIGFQDVDCFFKVFEHAMFGGRKIVLPQ
jgi:amino acid adenylation domain-containing protein